MRRPSLLLVTAAALGLLSCAGSGDGDRRRAGADRGPS